MDAMAAEAESMAQERIRQANTGDGCYDDAVAAVSPQPNKLKCSVKNDSNTSVSITGDHDKEKDNKAPSQMRTRTDEDKKTKHSIGNRDQSNPSVNEETQASKTQRSRLSSSKRLANRETTTGNCNNRDGKGQKTPSLQNLMGGASGTSSSSLDLRDMLDSLWRNPSATATSYDKMSSEKFAGKVSRRATADDSTRPPSTLKSKSISSKHSEQRSHICTPVNTDDKKYFLGDVAENDVIQDIDPVQASKDISNLKTFDYAFIRRSNDEWTYSIVADISEDEIIFVLDKSGAKKIFEKRSSNWERNIRMLKCATEGNPTKMDVDVNMKTGKGRQRPKPKHGLHKSVIF